MVKILIFPSPHSYLHPSISKIISAFWDNIPLDALSSTRFIFLSFSWSNCHSVLELRYCNRFAWVWYFIHSSLCLCFSLSIQKQSIIELPLPKPSLHWSENHSFVVSILRFLTPNASVFSMDVMGHLAIHSFSSHATYLDTQQLAALMWVVEIIKTLRIIKI